MESIQEEKLSQECGGVFMNPSHKLNRTLEQELYLGIWIAGMCKQQAALPSCHSA